mmetsp:Transcript_11751/g.29995  ORF Transcript_11751/g.29995 Transcript_11751/m.29995 type:complete len:687 (+) Transcript_11751:1-2061(+)
MVEMCCGIQHPVRGLFLRSYLTQVAKEGLMMIEDKKIGEGGEESSDVGDAIEFLLQNFTEMNKLWVRMQHQGSVSERSRREKERQELRDLVAKNLVMLAQLDGVDQSTYAEVVLPRVLEQIIACKDELAQNYLMDCVIQVFPDAFHIQNIDKFLEACGSLHPGADVSAIVRGLVKRLSRYIDDGSGEEFEQTGAFDKILEPIMKMSATMEQGQVAGVYEAMMDLTVCQGKAMSSSSTLGRVDTILSQCAKALSPDASSETVGQKLNRQAARTLVSMLTLPLDTFSITEMLELSSYPSAMQILDRPSRKQVAVNIVEKMLHAGTVMPNADKVVALFDFISLLVENRSSSDSSSNEDEHSSEDEEEIEEEQNLVARLVHQLTTDNVEESFKILGIAKDRFERGGPLRVKHTLPPIVFETLSLIMKIQSSSSGEGSEERVRKMFQFLHATIDTIAEVPQPEKALQLYLECTLIADMSKMEDNAYDFMTSAFDVYENSIPDTKAQVEALACLIGTLHECKNFGEDNWDTLVTTATKWSIKLLKKSDQCKAVYSCSHLFWNTKELESGADSAEQDSQGEKVLVCLKKALTIARQAQGIAKSARGDVGPVELFVAILNKYLYFFDRQGTDTGGKALIKAEDVQNLLDLVSNETSNLTGGDDPVLRYYHNTLKHIMHCKERTPEKYDGVSLKQ